jgi:fibronectin type 3 domain-containing protein
MKHIVFAALIAFAVTGSLSADLLYYDGFDAPLDTSVTNTYGGVGWADATWSLNYAWNTPLDSSNSKVVDGLSYSDGSANLRTTGNALLIEPVNTGENEGYVLQRAATSASVVEGTTWESFLIQPQAGNDGRNDAGFFPSSTQSDNGAFFGFHWSTTFKFMNGGDSGIERVLGETYFILLRVDTVDGGDDTAYAWINPSLTDEPDISTADATQTRNMVIGDGAILRNKINANQGANANIYDEYRVGQAFADVTPSDVPDNVQASDGTFDDKVQVTWDSLEGASTYTVYRAETNDSSVASSLQSGIVATTYDDTTAAPLQLYWYWVKSDLSTAFSAGDSGYRAQSGIPIPPDNVSATDGTYTDKIVVTWDTSENADRYLVLRNTENNSSTATNISGEISTNYYEDTGVVQGASYYYWVKAGNTLGWSFPSDPDIGSTPYDAIAYEGFDYTPGENINGKEGGLGWDGSWVASADTVQEVQSDGLTYPGLQTSGKSVKLEAYEVVGKKAEGNRETVKEYGAQTNDIWYSFLLKPVIRQVGHVFLIPNGTWDCGSGKRWGSFLSLHNWDSDITAEEGETYFMVVRCVNGGAYLWINPPLDREPVSGMADVSQENTTLSRNNTINIQVQRYYQTNTFIFDEIRVGYNWDQVSPNYLVKNVQASDGTYDDKVAVTWDTRSDAAGYTVYRSTENDSSLATAVSGELTDISYDDTTASAGTVYYYFIKARFTDGTEQFSYSDAGYRSVAGAPVPPQNVNASDGVADQSYVRITWDAVTGADMYRVYRNNKDDYASSEAVSSDIAATEYLDSDVAAGVAYYYWVRAKNATGWSNYSDPDTGYIPAQLVAYYAMDELEGTNMLDSSDNDFHGVYRDNPTLGVASADAVLFNTAVNFYISDAVINSNSPIRDMTNNFTVALWVNPDEIGQDEYRYLFAPEEDSGWNLSVYNRQVVFNVPGVGGTWSPNNVISNSSWTHVAVTYNHLNYVSMYIDGLLAREDQFYGAPAQYVKCNTLVANGGEQELFIGSLDEIHVYSGVLSDHEILLLAGIPEPGVLGVVILGALGVFITRRR